VIPFSVLDLAPVTEGSDAGAAFANSLDLARHAEAWGYERYWLAEHHNMPGIASAATAVVIGHVAAGTSRIRVGSGGVMLPNHAPIVVAEQFGTLAALFPGRIDLGLGRAPGTDMLTARALRRDLADSADRFPQDVVELLAYFEDEEPGQRIRAVPGAGLKVPVWLLGSSLFSASLAAMLGLPFAFAAHFAPEHLIEALEIYRGRFQPSQYLARPYAMVGLQVVAADTDAAARLLFTSAEQQMLSLRFGTPGKLPPPKADLHDHLGPSERAMLDQTYREAIVGGPQTVRRGLESVIARTGADELIVAAQIYDHAARLRSYEILAEVRAAMAEAEAA